MSKYRTEIKPDVREQGLEEVRESLTTSKHLPNLVEMEDNLDLPKLLAKRDMARLKLLENKGNIKLRQEWLFYEALYRDVKYSMRGRGWMRQLGWDGLLEEVYSCCRTGVDANLDD